MWNFLEKLRELPERSRKAVVLFSSMFITATVLVSWLVFPVPHFGSLSSEEKERKSVEKLITPFSIIGEEVHGVFGNIKGKWSSLRGVASLLPVASSLKENRAQKSATSTEL